LHEPQGDEPGFHERLLEVRTGRVAAAVGEVVAPRSDAAGPLPTGVVPKADGVDEQASVVTGEAEAHVRAVVGAAVDGVVAVGLEPVERRPERLQREIGRFDQGDITARAIADADKIWSWLSGLATYITAGFTLLAVLCSLVSVDGQLALVGLATIPLATVFALRQVGTHNALSDAVARDTGAYTGAVDVAIAGIRAVKGLGAEHEMAQRAIDASSALERRAVGLARAEAWWVAGASGIPGAGLALGLWLGGMRVLDGEMTVGALVAFAGWMALLVSATTTLTERLTTRGVALAAAGRIAQLLVGERPPGLPTAPDVASTGRRVDLTVDGLTVKRGERVILRDVDLDVPAGSWTAIVGATGSGKTTLLRAIAGLEPSLLGVVRVGGIELDDHARAARTTYVPQNPLLVSGSIAEIVRLAAPSATDVEVERALAAVGADDILTATGGMDGIIGDRGLTLSGGQRQRLALAAAAARRPSVLLLDDVTSALDVDTEGLVIRGIRDLLPDTTVVLATHRSGAAASCDRVVVLADGGAMAGEHPIDLEMFIERER